MGVHNYNGNIQPGAEEVLQGRKVSWVINYQETTMRNICTMLIIYMPLVEED